LIKICRFIEKHVLRELAKYVFMGNLKKNARYTIASLEYKLDMVSLFIKDRPMFNIQKMHHFSHST